MDNSRKNRLESLIEKFITDIQEEYQQANQNKEDGGKRLLTLSTIAPPHNSSNIDLDKKIADLENLIQRLQSEITNVSLKSQNSNEGPLNLSDLTKGKDHNKDEEKDCTTIAACLPKDVNVTTSPFSITGTLSAPLNEASKRFDEAISDLMNVTKQIDSVTPSMDDIKSTINGMFKGEQENTEVVAFKDGLEELIQELKGEIALKMEELKDVDETLDNEDDG